MSKLTRELAAQSMLSSIENYVFEIIDSVENDVGVLTAEDHYTLNAGVRNAVEKAATELEADEQCRVYELEQRITEMEIELSVKDAAIIELRQQYSRLQETRYETSCRTPAPAQDNS
ncbi:hypothetical protein E1L25_23715 [Salmonella enterica subsp. enterica serovar Newport]|nr:hypothetical protein [Salmonella enterica subsp. enterica serovar Newport]